MEATNVNAKSGDRLRGSGRPLVLLMTCLLVALLPAVPAGAAVVHSVQSGVTTSSANGTVTVNISTVDTTKSFLLFQTRHNSNRPVGSVIRGRIASATTVEFTRATNESSTMTIQWYVVEFRSGVKVQRGSTTVSATPLNITITAVAAVNQAFVTWSKTPNSGDSSWGNDDVLLGELTTTTNLQFRTSSANNNHTIWWQVIEFTDSADINVQKGSITTMTGTTTSVTATLSPAVDVNSTFVLVGLLSSGGGSDIGKRIVRAQLTDSTTVTIDRSASGDDIQEIVWQAIELKDGSTVQRGSENFASAAGQKSVTINAVDTNWATPFGSFQHGGGQNMGRSSYAGDDILGVSSVTMSLASSTSITMDRDNTAAAADIGWFVVEWNRPLVTGWAEVEPN